VKEVPKAELHLHLDCSLSYAAVVQLDESISHEEYKREFIAPRRCTSLADFLTRAPRGFRLMQDEAALALVVEDVFEQLAADGVIYAEIRFAPLLHTERGLSPERVVEVVERAVERMVDLLKPDKVDEQAAMIARSLRVLERFTGTRPVGWLGPGLTQTLETPDLLAAAGIKYIGDWVYDDEPTEIRTAHGPLVTLPYTVELNDIPMMLVQHHESAYFTQRCIDSFERLYREGAERAKIMAIAIHPYISGQPHRIKYLEAVYDHVNRYAGVLHWNGAEILDWYMAARGNQ